MRKVNNKIWGNWYTVIDQGFIEFGSKTAKSKTIGMKLRYANMMNQIFEQEIVPEQILEDVHLKFSPIEDEERLEIHQAWLVKVLLEDTEVIKWHVHFSTITGEVLNIEVL